MRYKLVGILLLGIHLSMSGCQSVTMLNNERVGRTKTVHNDYYFWGLSGEHVIKLSNKCDGKIAKVTERFEARDILLRIVTLGIYSPRSYTIMCEQ